MLIAALLVIPVVVIEASSFGSGWDTFASVLNWLIWAAFLAELVTMLAVTDDRLGWLRSHPLEAAIVILTPPFLPASLQALRFFRLLRLLRIVVVANRIRRVLSVDGLKLAAVFAGVSALGGGAIFSSVEHRGYSVWDGTFWAVTTMATVGYGDLVPTTVVGRLVAMGLMLVGVGFFALLTGAVAQRFVVEHVQGDVQEAEQDFEREVQAARDEVLQELREIGARLQELERTVEMM